MYVPPPFAEMDRDTLHAFIERHPFALLISQHDAEPFASHLPFLLQRDAGPLGTLVGHMAATNPQWRNAEGQTILVVFSGPHAYISPAWYEAPLTVPTWNYVAVHAYGTFRSVRDPQPLTEIVRETVAVYEEPGSAWQLDTGGDFFKKLLPQIVGFRIELTRIEGKWKLNQNHPPERRAKVVAALAAKGDENSRAVAALMRAALGKQDSDAAGE
jgi:transcriptional regulator